MRYVFFGLKMGDSQRAYDPIFRKTEHTHLDTAVAFKLKPKHGSTWYHILLQKAKCACSVLNFSYHGGCLKDTVQQIEHQNVYAPKMLDFFTSWSGTWVKKASTG